MTDTIADKAVAPHFRLAWCYPASSLLIIRSPYLLSRSGMSPDPLIAMHSSQCRPHQTPNRDATRTFDPSSIPWVLTISLLNLLALALAKLTNEALSAAYADCRPLSHARRVSLTDLETLTLSGRFASWSLPTPPAHCN